MSREYSMASYSPLMLVQPSQFMNRGRDRPVFSEGDTPGALYRVEDGCVRLQKASSCGRRQIVAFRHPGDLFGLGAFGPGHVDAEAACPTVVSRISQARLRRILQSDPETGLATLESAHGGQGTITELLGLVCHSSSSTRVAWFLNGLSQRLGIPLDSGVSVALPMMRLDVADHLGMSVETLSREMTKLRSTAVIALDGLRRFTVLRPRLLEMLTRSD